MGLTNKDDHKDNCKELFEKLVKERFDEIRKKSNDETKHDDLTYYFTDNSARIKFDDSIMV